MKQTRCLVPAAIFLGVTAAFPWRTSVCDASGRDKTIHLYEGVWTDIDMSGDYTIPDTDISLSFDEKALYIRARVHDAHFRDGDRSWRYGDGFFITIAAPADDQDTETDRYYAYGFSVEKGKPAACLVNRDGTYFLRNVEEVTPNITVDPRTMTADYDITIPWRHLYPFHPLIDSRGGINIVYTSQNDDHSRKQLRYVPGTYDSEDTPFRSFAPVYFHRSEKSVFQLQGSVEDRLVHTGRVVSNLTVWSPDARQLTLECTVENSAGNRLAKRLTAGVSPGPNVIPWEMDLSDSDGFYALRVSAGDSLLWQDEIYAWDRDALYSMQTDVEQASAAGSPNTLAGVEGLQYRFRDLISRISRFTSRDDLQETGREIDRLKNAYTAWKETGTVYSEEGYYLSAFRSPDDASLQPFSIILPGNFDPSEPYTLAVGLHGSGVDETGFIRSASRLFAADSVIVIAPRGRGLSDWWTGQTEKDAVALIEMIQRICIVDRTICYGFSMGGYGTWRMTLLHPDLFDAAIVLSGFPYNPRVNTPQNDMNTHIGKGRHIHFLVIHGTEDRSLEIADTDHFVNRLVAAGYTIDYHRIEGAGHGDYFNRVPDIITAWLETVNP
ncbi:dienelactone hydrolase family protein [bacterium]|nr:dienelactone hydrolase family protein [bacterium]